MQEWLGQCVNTAVCQMADKVALGELRTLAEAQSDLATTIASLTQKFGPTIASELSPVIEPLAQKIMAVVRPSIEEALRQQVPTFAAITGGIIAASVLAGVWIARRTYRSKTRR